MKAEERSRKIRMHQENFLQGLLIKVGFVLVLAGIGKAPFLIAFGNWLMLYACVSAGFAAALRQSPFGRGVTYWDEGALFGLAGIAALCATRFTSM